MKFKSFLSLSMLILIFLSTLSPLFSTNSEKLKITNEITHSSSNINKSLEYKKEIIGARDKRNPTSVINNMNQFSWNIYKKISIEKENIFFSPFSILTALSMTYAGTEKSTKKEMKKALNILEQDDIFFNNISEILKDINNSTSCELKIANSLWGEKSYNFKKEYMTFVMKKFNSKLFEVDFIKNSKTLRLKINKWVSKITNEKIKNLIPKNILTSLTKLVLVNAIYFKGNWKHKFKESNTQKLPFYNENGTNSKVELMYQKSKFKFFKTTNYKLLQLPYKNNELSMNIILPNKEISIKELEKKLKFNNILNIINNSRMKKVKVYIPKFKFNLSLSLNEIMKKLGMIEAFTNSANFSKMSDKNDIKISKIIHKAFIDVNEEGTEAAAATAIIMIGKSMSRNLVPEPIFRVDHPFIFFIVDNKHKEILFIGRILNL